MAETENLSEFKYFVMGDLELTFRNWELHELTVLQQTTKSKWTLKASNHQKKPCFGIVVFKTVRKTKMHEMCSRQPVEY